MFNNSNEIPIDTGHFLISQVDVTWQSLRKDNTLTNSVRQPLRSEMLIRWIAPPTSERGLASGGGILRHRRGSFIRAFSGNFGTFFAYKAEVFAAHLGLA